MADTTDDHLKLIKGEAGHESHHRKHPVVDMDTAFSLGKTTAKERAFLEGKVDHPSDSYFGIDSKPHDSEIKDCGPCKPEKEKMRKDVEKFYHNAD